MKIRTLIQELVNYDMNCDIVIDVDKEHYDEYGKLCKGYLFDISSIEIFGSMITLKFDIDDLDNLFKDTDKYKENNND